MSVTVSSSASREEDRNSAADERAAHGAVAQRRRAPRAAHEVSTRQEHDVHIGVHAHAAGASVTQRSVLLQQRRRLCQHNVAQLPRLHHTFRLATFLGEAGIKGLFKDFQLSFLDLFRQYFTTLRVFLGIMASKDRQ